MPRARNEQNESGRLKTEIWRKKRRSVGRPETSLVDRAVAASLAAHFVKDVEADADRELYHAILRGATRLLVEQGFGKAETNSEIMRRLTRRSDLNSVAKIAVGPEASH